MHAEKWGPAGAVLAALCRLEVEPVVETLTALGLEGLLRDAVLLPLLAGFLGVTLWALSDDRRYHREPGPGRLAWAAAALAFGGLWVSAVVVGTGLALLVAASVWNGRLVAGLDRRRARARQVRKKKG